MFAIGIYRLSGVASTIKMLYDTAVIKGKDVVIEDYPIRTISSALKTYFREMNVGGLSIA